VTPQGTGEIFQCVLTVAGRPVAVDYECTPL
jgi:hypothetical protein